MSGADPAGIFCPMTAPAVAQDKKKKKIDTARAWAETRELMREHRGSLAIGLVLMVINRTACLGLPVTSKFQIDDVIGKGRANFLRPLAGAAAGATIIQAPSGFANS